MEKIWFWKKVRQNNFFAFYSSLVLFRRSIYVLMIHCLDELSNVKQSKKQHGHDF